MFNNFIIILPKFMQIIDKPKQYRLPFRIYKKMLTSESQNKLPKIYLQSKELKRKSKQKMNAKDNTVSYISGNDMALYRPALRDALAKYLNFQRNEDCISKFLPEELIHKLKQPIKAILYTTDKFKLLFKIITEIFGDDFDIGAKDILAAYGPLSRSSYVFFTASYYQPYSLCCRSIIYLKVTNSSESNFLNHRYFKQAQQQSNANCCKITNYFVCSKCEQIVLTIQCKTQQFINQSRAIGRENLQLEVERQKISMAIMVSSGKFKRMRIDSTSQKQISASQISQYNPQDSVGIKQLTPFQLRPLLQKRRLQSGLK